MLRATKSEGSWWEGVGSPEPPKLTPDILVVRGWEATPHELIPVQYKQEEAQFVSHYEYTGVRPAAHGGVGTARL